MTDRVKPESQNPVNAQSEQQPEQPEPEHCTCEDNDRVKSRKTNRTSYDCFLDAVPDTAPASCPICMPLQAAAQREHHRQWIEFKKRSGNYYYA